MEVSKMLCVGRGRLSQFGKTHSSESGFHTPERKSSADINNGTGLTEKELVARVSSKLTRECLSPPTKSILRGRVPSPKQGSPSSLRSVRFSDKGDDDEIMYAKIHVNKNIQTEQMNKDKTHKETRPGQSFKLDLAENHEEFNPKSAPELRTSTPRYSILEETPSLDFHKPRGHQEVRKCSNTSPIRGRNANQGKSNSELKETIQHSDSKHERLVFDIDIDRKRATERLTRPGRPESKETRSTKGQERKSGSMNTGTRSGNKIIQNMELNRSLSKSPERPMIPDGNRIIQNLDLSSGDIVEKVRSTASQTSCSDTSSPRSASPETPYENANFPDGRDIIKNMELNVHESSRKTKSVQTIQIPDGEKIIQNLELSSRDSSFKITPESPLVVNLPDGRKITQNMELMNTQGGNRNISIGIQAFDEDTIEDDSVRSVSVQTYLNDSEDNSQNESLDLSNSRSIAVQTQADNGSTIPDGSKITRNMTITQSEKTKQFTDSRNDKKTLNDSNWNEFVRHLELFNPSQSSSSSVSEEEIPPPKASEPILVYNRSAPSPEAVKMTASISQEGNPANIQRVSDRSAGAFLKSEAYTKHQYESILREEGLLSKYDVGIKSMEDSSASARQLVEKAFAKNTEQVERKKMNANKQNNVSTFSKQNSEQLGNQQVYRSGNIPISTYYKQSRTDTSGMNIHNQHDQTIKKSDKDNLGFTPIETYSFNPETLMKTAAKRACSQGTTTDRTLKGATHKTSTSPPFGTKESVTKNSFIQGLDLGPVPRPLNTSKRYNSLSQTGMMSERPTNETAMSQSRYDSTFLSKFDRNYGKDFYERPKSHENESSVFVGNNRPLATTLSSQSSSGFRTSRYTHVTGQQQKSFSSDNRYSLSQNRPSSAPSTRSSQHSSSSSLSSTLREMRNNAPRKNAMCHFSDMKRRSPTLVKSSNFSTPTQSTRVDSQYTSYLKSSKYSMNDYTRSNEYSMQNDIRSTRGHSSHTLPSQSSYRSKESSCSPRRASPCSPRRASPQRSDYMYLSALNDQSNARPSSRERSRSRSPAQSPSTEYGKNSYGEPRYSSQRLDTLSKMHSLTRNPVDMKRFIDANEDRGSFDSVVSSGSRISHMTSGSHVERSSSRESRPLTRKPPLPRTRRSLSNGRSRSRSADSLSRENTKPAKDLNKEKYEKQHNNTGAGTKHIPVEKKSQPKLDQSGRDKISSELGTVTVGNVPPGLADPECMFLGHDTIQKIIEEAKL